MTEFEEIAKKLEGIEDRLQNLESNKNVIEEERTEIASEGELESEETSLNNDTVVTIRRVAICDYCTKKKDIFAICKKCKKKLCDKCAVDLRNQVLCPDDLRTILPLSRPAFKVLLLVANDIQGEADMHTLSGIPRKDIKEILTYLKSAGYVESSVIFNRKSPSDMGREAITAYGQIFGGMGEMAQLDRMIERYVLGRS